jgi:hypothetical protein
MQKPSPDKTIIVSEHEVFLKVVVLETRAIILLRIFLKLENPPKISLLISC